MTSYFIKSRTRKYVKGYGFLLCPEIYPTNMRKN